MSDIPEQIRDYIRDELQGVYTILLGVIESVDTENHRCTVSLKNDPEVVLNEVPIATPYANGSAGIVTPLSSGAEGMLLCSKDPIEDLLATRGHEETVLHRQHSFQDAIFFGQFWFDDDTVPSYTQGEYVVAHESGTVFRMKPSGEAVIEHTSGNVIRMGSDGTVTIGDPDAAESVAVQQHTHTVTLSDGTERETTTPNESGTTTLID